MPRYCDNPDELPYFQDLQRISEALKAEGRVCPMVASRVVFLVTGLPEMGGFVRGERGRHDPREHFWNYDPDNFLYVHLTLSRHGDYPPVAALYQCYDFHKPTPMISELQRRLELPRAKEIARSLCDSL